MLSMCRYYDGEILHAKVLLLCRELWTKWRVTENQLQKRYNNNEDGIEIKLQAYYHNKQAKEYEALDKCDVVRI